MQEKLDSVCWKIVATWKNIMASQKKHSVERELAGDSVIHFPGA